MKYIVTDTICQQRNIYFGGDPYPAIKTKIIAICSTEEKAEEIKQKTMNKVKETIDESQLLYHNIDISEVEEC